jgi:Na+/melibiose symporter-like transporter
METFINIGLYVAYIAFIAAIALLVIFPVYHMLTGNFGKAKGSLIGIGILVVVLLIAYLLSPADQGAYYTKMGVGPGLSKVIGTGLLTTYIMFGGLIIVILYTSVTRWFK